MPCQEPPFALKSLPDPSPARLHRCRYLHVRRCHATPMPWLGRRTVLAAHPPSNRSSTSSQSRRPRTPRKRTGEFPAMAVASGDKMQRFVASPCRNCPCLLPFDLLPTSLRSGGAFVAPCPSWPFCLRSRYSARKAAPASSCSAATRIPLAPSGNRSAWSPSLAWNCALWMQCATVSDGIASSRLRCRKRRRGGRSRRRSAAGETLGFLRTLPALGAWPSRNPVQRRLVARPLPHSVDH